MLAEYESAAERVRGDEQAIAVSNGVLVAALAPLIPTVGTFLSTLFNREMAPAEAWMNLALSVLVLWFATAVLVRYLCQLRRSLVHSSRKLIVLRRMLGLNYGGANLILPNWRLEGADNPFALTLFPGWTLRGSFALFSAAFLSSTSLFAMLQAALPVVTMQASQSLAPDRTTSLLTSVAFASAWGGLVLWRTRLELMDLYEDSWLSTAKLLANSIGLHLEPRVQTVLYKARLARHEAKRLELNFNDLKRLAVFREDRRFERHSGVSYRAISRALYQRIRGNQAGGGSTIAQQLGRTLFVLDRQKTVRRKIVEIPLAYWLTKIMPRDELLEVYLCSVRFDVNVNGVLSALRHFFDAGPDGLTTARAVVLVERISNVRRKFRATSITIYLKALLNGRLISLEMVPQIEAAYEEMRVRGRLETTSEEIREAMRLVTAN